MRQSKSKANVVLLFGNVLLGISLIAIFAAVTFGVRFPAIPNAIFLMGNGLLAAIGTSVAIIAKTLIAIEERIQRLENR